MKKYKHSLLTKKDSMIAIISNIASYTDRKAVISLAFLWFINCKVFGVSSLADATQSISTQADAAIKICKIAIGVVLAISLVVIIYYISQGSHRAKEGLIGWLVAVAVYAVGLAVIGR